MDASRGIPHALDKAVDAAVEHGALAAWLPRRRWYRSKSKTLRSVEAEARAELGDARLCVLRAWFEDGTFERYALPVFLADPSADLPEAAVIAGAGVVSQGSRLCDACWSPAFREALYEMLRGSREAELGAGVLRGSPVASADLHAGDGRAGAPESRVLGAEQSNTSFSYGSSYFVKLYRRLDDATNPEPEVLRFLREQDAFRRVPAFVSSLEWNREEGATPITVALMQELVPARGDGWAHALEHLRRALAGPEPSLAAGFAAWVRTLGRRVAELHLALGAREDLPAFSPEPLAPEDLVRIRTETRRRLGAAFALLEKRPGEDAQTAALVRLVLSGRARLESLLDRAAAEGASGAAIRTHGDLHLGQVLPDGDDVWILDFEGEPGRPMEEARRKQSPWRDVAGMLRSFHYAAHAAARETGSPEQAERLAQALREAFLEGYREGGGGSGSDPAAEALLSLFTLEKAVYELDYEINNRPDWMQIPLRGLHALAAGE